jgi:hypothetical protein
MRILYLSGFLYFALYIFASFSSASVYIQDNSGYINYTCSSSSTHCMVVPFSRKTDGSVPGWSVRAYCPNDEDYISWSGSFRTWTVNDSENQEPNGFTCSLEPPPPVCESPNFIDSESLECVSPSYCSTVGQSFSEESGSCVAQCPNGALNGVCLNGAPIGEPNLSEDSTECKPSKVDYSGVFNGKHYCDSNLPEPATCPDGFLPHIVDGGYSCGSNIESPDDAGDQEGTATICETVGTVKTCVTRNESTGKTTTTTEDSSNGNSTTTDNYPGTDSETGGACSADSVSCVATPESEKGSCEGLGPLCQEVSDIKDLLSGESDRTTKTGEFTDTNPELETARNELTTGFNSIKSEISGYFDMSLSSTSVACFASVTVMGMDLEICPGLYMDELQVIAQIVLLIAGLLSMLIILR